ncbi:MAG TPA: energy-coupling factor transporter transmembrane component T [Deltaproteobacteria bacterium]|nr:energy-coupling factor transporter transmembrane component T [Deltaproteobacteria bacterium]HOM29046.1 energy-coupling factor transporter transmembrane component T [Deltaproteobacteria bacterium]HPP80012.1 energy-coupling factor transporter transmembrane component T [Deltaproteobacteria bacterium]
MKTTLGQYLPRDSLVHALDARVKLVVMGLSIGVSFRLDRAGTLVLFALGLVFCTFISKISFGDLYRGLKPFIWLFAATALLHVFMTGGDPLPLVPFATRQGLEGGIRVGAQLVLALWVSTLTTLTTSSLDMVWAMQWFMRPLKYLNVPTEEIALAVMLAIRFIPLLFEEADRITRAQKARGVDLESGNVFRRTRAMVSVVVPLMHGAFRRAEDLAVALTLRGYRPGIVRSRMREPRVSLKDGVCTALVCLWYGFLLAV